MKETKQPKPPDLGEFTLDPTDPTFRRLRGVCEPGHPWRCLIATAASVALGRRMTVRLDHERQAGKIGVTVGPSRYEREMTPEEVAFASKFDLGRRMRKPLTVRVHLDGGSWTARPKRTNHPPSGKARRRDGKPRTKSIRARQLAAIKARMAEAE